MKPTERQKQLDEYAAGTLGHDAMKELLVAAFEDEAVLDEMVEARELQELFATQGGRDLLEEALQSQPKPLGDRISTGFFSRAGWSWTLHAWRWAAAVAGVAAVSVVAIILLPRDPSQKIVVTPAFGEPSANLGGSETHDKAFQLHSRPYAIATLNKSGADPVYHPGDDFWLNVAPLDDLNLYVFERRQDGVTRRLYPNPFQPSSRAQKNDQIGIAPDGSERIKITGPLGARLLRIVLLPPEFDLNRIDINELDRRSAVIDIRYTVVDR